MNTPLKMNVSKSSVGINGLRVVSAEKQLILIRYTIWDNTRPLNHHKPFKVILHKQSVALDIQPSVALCTL